MKRLVHLGVVIALALVLGCDAGLHIVDQETTGVIEDTSQASPSGPSRSVWGGESGSTLYQFRILPGDTETKSFDLQNPGNRFILSFNARLDRPHLAGADYSLRISIDGSPLNITSLVNKPQIRNYNGPYPGQYTYRDGRRFHWFNNANSGAVLSLLYAPNFWENNVTGTGYGVIGGEATVYEFDVTDALRPGANTITFENFSSSYEMVVGGLMLYEEIASTPSDFIVPQGQEVTLPFTIADESKSHFVRHFSRIEYPNMAGAEAALVARVDGFTLSKFNLINKPLNAYSYPFDDHRYKFVYNDERMFDLMNNFHHLHVMYSPNMSDNNVSTGPYGVAGGEAYQWDFLVPTADNTVGDHVFSLKNVHLGNQHLIVEGLRAYAVHLLP